MAFGQLGCSNITFVSEELPLPMNKIKEFLPSGQIELVDYRVEGSEEDLFQTDLMMQN